MHKLMIASLVFTLFAPAAQQRTTQGQSAQPIKTMNRRGAKGFYYEKRLGHYLDSLWLGGRDSNPDRRIQSPERLICLSTHEC